MVGVQYKEALKLQVAARARASVDYLLFVKYTFPKFEINWHHRSMSEKLEDFAYGRTKKLMIFAPPQVGKTEMCTRRLVPFIHGLFPEKRIGLAAYSPTISTGFNRDIQRIMTSRSYKNVFPDTTLNERDNPNPKKYSYVKNQKHYEVVGTIGSFKSVGVGTPATSITLDIGLIDDPIKDKKEADSMTYSDRLWDWYENVWSTRFHNDSQQLLTVTRWHEMDLAGRILAMYGDQWEILVLPAINEEGPNSYDPRNIGEALWPKKHNLESYLIIRDNNVTKFTSMYQQRPAPLEGGIIKREFLQIKPYSEIPEGVFEQTMHFFVDTAYTDKQKNDPSGILDCVEYENMLYIFKFQTVRKEFSELIDHLESYVRENGSKKSKVFIEPKASGLSIYQYMKKKTNLNVIEYEMESGSKRERVMVIEPKLSSKRVVLVRDNWNKPFINECLIFDNGAHDEAVDTLTMAATQLLYRKKSTKNRTQIKIYN